MTPETYQLSDLTNFLQRVMALNLPDPVWVAAELAQVNFSRGHCWLTLVEKDTADDDAVRASLEAVIWARQLKQIRQMHGVKLTAGLLQQGMSVRLRVTTKFHERFGLRLIVEEVDPTHTLGDLERRRQRTLEQLSLAGLLDRNAGLTLHPIPRRVAIISSETAAGLADFTRQLADNPYGYDWTTRVFGAAMQGGKAGPEIIGRLKEIRRFWLDDFDVVVIVRGGGARTDLAPFDGELLCRAVAEFPLPVLVGVGHETDASVLDRVAHLSLKTPTATAVYLINRLQRAEAAVLQAGRRIHQVAGQVAGMAGARLDHLHQGIGQAGRATLAAERSRLRRVAQDLDHLPARTVAHERLRTEQYARLLDALRPATTLARGYAMVSQEGRLVTDPADIEPGRVTVRLKGGSVDLTKEAER